uniref:AlNc14C18G1859 protein n=1 Tax=Albugo laibachii Nc14 TaxID=890382 RepID=F0W4N8_9STRA|nr:AlNc14C18G1859 [Albugo laibachii Nc14]|eukprot:CCA16072.1 AlNc14C18G1859 [Albugo laibachii Nc14]
MGKHSHMKSSKFTRSFLSSNAHKSKRSYRVRYFIELVIQSVQRRAIRVGFHGTFEALYKLHLQLEKLWWHVHAPSLHPNSKATEPLPSFPESSKSLASRLEARKNYELERMNARSQALFQYYTALFNTVQDREFFLEVFRERAEDRAITRHNDPSQDTTWQCPSSSRVRFRNSSSTTVTSASSEEYNGINRVELHKDAKEKKVCISSRLLSLVILSKEKDEVEFTAPTVVNRR